MGHLRLFMGKFPIVTTSAGSETPSFPVHLRALD
jgi:hypothetical protein